MATTISSSQLDFAGIKAGLIDHLRKQDQFTDYDFEASGMSALLDVLAYNTHTNALIANYALNETFLTTAQLRSSMVNHAIKFAYVPGSKAASRATLNLSVDMSGLATRPAEITLPIGTVFVGTLGDQTYNFRTLVEYKGYDTTGTGIYTFQDSAGNAAIFALEGTLTTKTFLADTTEGRQIYVIPDTNLDLATLTVNVFDDVNSTNFEAYTSANLLTTGLSADTRLFVALETYNGFYEINFGDGIVTGRAPEPGNLIRATYLSTNGIEANGIDKFEAAASFRYNNQSYNYIITPIGKTAFGAEKEGVESIRANAPLSYLAQNRFVTPIDYIGIIANTIPGIKSINAWGGEDNVPQKYGKAIVSIEFTSDVSAVQRLAVEQQIQQILLSSLSMISIDTEFVTPEKVYLNLTTNVDYDPSKTNLTENALEVQIANTISSYFATNLGKFNDVFRKSKLTPTVDAVDNSILSSNITVELENRLVPFYNTTTQRYVKEDYTLSFLSVLREPDDSVPIITSDAFRYQLGDGTTVIVTIENNTGSDRHSTNLRLVDSRGNVIVSSVGEYVPSTGKVNLRAFQPYSIVSGQSYIGIKAKPVDESVVKPLRNQIINLGRNIVDADPDIDFANSVVGTTN